MSGSKSIKIACLTFGINQEVFLNAKKRFSGNDIELVLRSCDFENIEDIVEEEWKNGAEVFVSSGANLGIFQEQFEYPIVPIEASFLDYYYCLKEALTMGDRIAVAFYKVVPKDLITNLENILGIKIKVIEFNTKNEIREKIQKNDFDVIVGGALVQEIANEENIKSAFIYPGEETITEAIKSAIFMAKNILKEQHRMEMNRVFFEELPNAVFEVDKNGKVVNCNDSFTKLLGKSKMLIKGKYTEELLPEIEKAMYLFEKDESEGQFITINSKVYHVLASSIRSANMSFTGTILVLQEVSQIEKAEKDYNARNKITLVQRGMKAKYHFDDIIGESKAILEAKSLAKTYAKTNYNIMIHGETGSGKELFAQSIHNASDRCEEPFVAINCGALPESLLESELFGYSEGAFTGGKKGGKPGIFEIGNHGTIFLDEVGEMSPKLQVRLLRVLQEKEIMRIGDNKIIPVDVRIISATNKTFEEMVLEKYRKDLLYRMNVLSLELPRLKDRELDIVTIFKYLVDNIDEDIYTDYDDSVYKILGMYSWPGNVRELENVCMRFSLFVRDNKKVLPDNKVKDVLVKCIGEDVFIKDYLEQIGYGNSKERNIGDLTKSIKSVCKIDDEKLSEYLGISRSTLWRKNKNVSN